NLDAVAVGSERRMYSAWRKWLMHVNLGVYAQLTAISRQREALNPIAMLLFSAFPKMAHFLAFLFEFDAG
ncbi:MAG: hypothetical protein ACYCZU_06585, partial [Devosia sp.]